MFTFETPALTYSERILFRIRNNSIRLFFVAKVLVCTFILLYFHFFTGALFCWLFLCLLLLPYFMGTRIYVTEWKIINNEVTIVYKDFNKTKTIQIKKEDVKVEFEPSSGIYASRIILLDKPNAKTLLIQSEIGRWFVENMQVLKEEYP